jgi:hypothetical protein
MQRELSARHGVLVMRAAIARVAIRSDPGEDGIVVSLFYSLPFRSFTWSLSAYLPPCQDYRLVLAADDVA